MILGQYRKSEESWRLLVKQFPENPEVALGLAQVLFHRNNFSAALSILEPFSKCDEKLHVDCLGFTCDILEVKGRFEEGFQLLENCRDKIKDDYRLLLKHLDEALHFSKN